MHFPGGVLCIFEQLMDLTNWVMKLLMFGMITHDITMSIVIHGQKDIKKNNY
jgi:hypothetical protein